MRASSYIVMRALKSSLPKHSRAFLVRFCIVIVALFIVYSMLFNILMSVVEGREYSTLTGVYWTLVVMSTQGFGDIVFTSDIGKFFTMIVNITGIVVMLILLPFVVMEFVYNPLMRAQKDINAPRSLPEGTKGHVLIVNFDAAAESLIERLQQHKIPYFILIEDPNEATKFTDMGFSVLVGSKVQTQTYENAFVNDASLVVVNEKSDPVNTKIVFTIREVSETVPIVSFVYSPDAIDILELAKSTQVLDVSTLMGKALARCAAIGGSSAHILGQVDDLLVIEAETEGTELVGKTLRELDLSKKLGITVVGIWERGNFIMAGPQTRFTESTKLVMAASEEQLKLYNEQYGKSPAADASLQSVLIVGAGSIGFATARYLRERNIPFMIIDKDEQTNIPREFEQNIIVGNGEDLAFLKTTNFQTASSILITTHDDDINLYLTLYFRRLRPDVQIISRTNHESSVSSLHRAGADFVLSSATIASTALYNHLRQGSVYTMVEGLFATKYAVPKKMIGKSLVNLKFRQLTGTSVVALETAEGEVIINPSPFEPIQKGSQLIMVLTPEAEAKLMKNFG